MYIYYIRHGEPIYNPDSLTELGVKQAHALANRLKDSHIDIIYASSSNRAILTASPLAKLINKDINIADYMNEAYAFNDFSSINEKGIRTWVYNIQKYIDIFTKEEMIFNKYWYESDLLKDTKFKEGYLRIKNESDKFLLSLGFKHVDGYYQLINKNEKKIAIFAHEGFGKLFLSYLLDLPYPYVSTHYELGHSDMTIIYFDESKKKIIPKVLMWSNDSHLYKEDLSTLYIDEHKI